MLRRLGLPIALSVVALLGASSAQGVPAAGPGYVASFQIAYDSPPFPDTRYRVTVSFAGDVCGDPFDGTWGFEATRTGGPSSPPPTLAPVTFAVENPVTVTGDRWIDAERGRDRPHRLHPALQPGCDTDAHTVVAGDGRHRERRRHSDGRPDHRADVAECPAARPPPPPPPPPLSTPSGTATGTVLVNGKQYASAGRFRTARR